MIGPLARAYATHGDRAPPNEHLVHCMRWHLSLVLHLLESVQSLCELARAQMVIDDRRPRGHEPQV
eukprot:scaffold195571_cov31-Tisochrysis_lutea.AAC.2